MNEQDRIIANVYETYEYEKFRPLLGNRRLDHVKAIMSSIADHGDIKIPLIVNERLEVIDGQHTLEAKKRLGLPVQYIVCPGYGIKECIASNSATKNWSLENFINCYAEHGMEDYKVLRSLEADYSDKLPKAVIRSIAVGVIACVPNQRIRDGKFKLGGTEPELRAVLDFLAAFEMPSTVRGNRQLLYSVLRFCYSFSSVDNAKLMKQWIAHSPLIQGVTDIRSAAEAIEMVYNRRAKSGYAYIATEYRKAAKEGGTPDNPKTSWAKREEESE